MENNEANFFEKFGLKVCTGEVEVGEIYPIFGSITKIVDEAPGSITVEINHSIRAYMTIPDAEKIELLKQRAFDPGIFISTVLSKNDVIEVECSTVIFGRPEVYNA